MATINNDNFQFEKMNRPDAVREHETALFAKRMTEVPTNMQGRWIYDGSGNPIYAGYAARGITEASGGWLLHKFTWSGANCTKREIAYDSWADATLACYL